MVRLEGLGQVKNLNDFIATRTLDLPASSIMPQLTTLPHIPLRNYYYYYCYHYSGYYKCRLCNTLFMYYPLLEDIFLLRHVSVPSNHLQVIYK
jgi:hypothetical protein